jgi:hypothetical protein
VLGNLVGYDGWINWAQDVVRRDTLFLVGQIGIDWSCLLDWSMNIVIIFSFNTMAKSRKIYPQRPVWLH